MNNPQKYCLKENLQQLNSTLLSTPPLLLYQNEVQVLFQTKTQHNTGREIGFATVVRRSARIYVHS